MGSPRAVGGAGPALVEEDQAGKRSEPLEEADVKGVQPGEDHAEEEGHEDEVNGTIADDLVGDRNVAAPCVRQAAPRGAVSSMELPTATHLGIFARRLSSRHQVTTDQNR